MKLLAVLFVVASAVAWHPPAGLDVEEFAPEIPTKSHDLTWCSKSTEDPLACYLHTLNKEGIDVEVQNDYADKVSGIRHVYLRQTVNGIPVENAVANININKDGKIISNYNRFTLRSFRSSFSPSLTAIDALKMFTRIVLHREVPEDIAVVTDADLADDHDVVMDTTTPFAYQPMYADLCLLEGEDEQLTLVWQVNVDFDDVWYDVCVDAVTGETLKLTNFVHWFSYNAFPHTVVDPEDGPNAARELLPELIDPVYSPLGWHDAGNIQYRNTRGNNVNAQENLSGGSSWENNQRPTADGSDRFDFELDLTKEPRDYLEAATTNLFYHCNIFHDFLYVYGFDEVSGNFQQDNFGRGGRGNDAVIANCQDGSGTNNANFATPADGSAGRMRMYTWTTFSPRRDGDFDSGIIYHEFGHGVSNRLTGGPQNVACLGGSQPGGMGEGWSDFIPYMLRQRPEYNRNDVFGTGTYIVPELTIRNWPYSSNETVAPQQYNYIIGQPIHQIGAIWCTILLEVYWNFVDEFGFDPDWFSKRGGNAMMMQVLLDGMKIQPCSPTLVQARDAILQAIVELYDEPTWCLAWRGFAKRGLGSGALPDGRANSYDVPQQCLAY